MAKLRLLRMDGTQGNEIELPAAFEVEASSHVLYEAVKVYRKNQRQGTAKAKRRGEVSGGGRKPYKQKGTGNARAGSNTSPIWVRGGKAHGPEPREYRTGLNRKTRRKALRMALGLKAREGNLKVVEALEISEPKTKTMVDILHKVGATGTALLVLENDNPNVLLSGRNLEKLSVVAPNEMNVFDVMRCEQLLFTQKSLRQLAEVLKI
jgi:large subunit ribosomal protein L4